MLAQSGHDAAPGDVRNFTGEYIICDDPDVDNDGYGDWDGNNTWITSIKS